MSKKFAINTLNELKSFVKSSDIDELKKIYKENGLDTELLNKKISLKEEDFDFKINNGKNLAKELIEASFATDNSLLNEFEAGKILYESLKDLKPKQASDIGFWTYHNHFTFYEYIARRWNGLWNGNVENPNYIINHWIQTSSIQGDLIDYPISGLWWSFYLTDDKDNNANFELTKILFKNESLRTKMLGSARFARHKPAILGVLEFIKEKKLDTNSLESAGRAIVPYINLLGGIRPISYFSKDWFKEKLENQFGNQIREGIPLFTRPEKTINISQGLVTPPVIKDDTKKFDNFFCLNKHNGNYLISQHKNDEGWDFCIGFNSNLNNQFLIHFYREGKINKTKLGRQIIDMPLNKIYLNGKNDKLKLVDLKIETKEILFGIAFKNIRGIYVKVMDGQDETLFREDQQSLNQEGKKILYYLNEPFKVAYKLLPFSIKNDLGSILKKSPTSYGIDITSEKHKKELEILKIYWPNLFNNKIEWW